MAQSAELGAITTQPYAAPSAKLSLVEVCCRTRCRISVPFGMSHIVSRTRPIACTDDTQAVKCATPAFRNTKIVGTMGPSCWDVETLGSEWMTLR